MGLEVKFMWNEVLEDLVVVKRSGQRVMFNASKIAIAIKNAFDSVYENSDEKKIYKVFEKVLNYINDNYRERKTINVEDVQDIIESKLKEEKYLDVYNSFSEYRKKRAASRKVFAEKQQHKFVKAIEKIQENNNLKTASYLSPYNTLYKFGRIVSNEYTKSYILDNKFVRAQEEGNIYIHDLDYFSLGLLSSVHLKLNGDNTIDSILNTIVNVQNEINGEIGIDNLDYLLVPWIIKKYKSIVKKNVNNYLNVVGILAFINIRKIEEVIDKEEDLIYDKTKYDSFLLNEQITNVFECAFSDAKKEIIEVLNYTINKLFKTISSNHQRDTKYNISLGSNNSFVGLLITDGVICVLKENDYLSDIKVIFKVRKESSLINKICDLVIDKKNIGLILNNNSVEYFSNGARIYDNTNGEKISNGRMIVSTTSINLARLGLKYRNRKIKDFYLELDEILELVKNELLLSFETIGNKTYDNYEILFKGTIYEDEKLEPNQKIRKVIKNGTLNVGLIGLKECVIALESDPEKQYDLVIDVLKRLDKSVKKYSEECKLNFGLFETSDIKSRNRLIGIDKAIYGNVKYVTDKDSYELIDTLKNMDYQKMANIEKLFNHGNLYSIILPSNSNVKKVKEVIDNLLTTGITYVNIKVGK